MNVQTLGAEIISSANLEAEIRKAMSYNIHEIFGTKDISKPFVVKTSDITNSFTNYERAARFENLNKHDEAIKFARLAINEGNYSAADIVYRIYLARKKFLEIIDLAISLKDKQKALDILSNLSDSFKGIRLSENPLFFARLLFEIQKIDKRAPFERELCILVIILQTKAKELRNQGKFEELLNVGNIGAPIEDMILTQFSSKVKSDIFGSEFTTLLAFKGVALLELGTPDGRVISTFRETRPECIHKHLAEAEYYCTLYPRLIEDIHRLGNSGNAQAAMSVFMDSQTVSRHIHICNLKAANLSEDYDIVVSILMASTGSEIVEFVNAWEQLEVGAGVCTVEDKLLIISGNAIERAVDEVRHKNTSADLRLFARLYYLALRDLAAGTRGDLRYGEHLRSLYKKTKSVSNLRDNLFGGLNSRLRLDKVYNYIPN